MEKAKEFDCSKCLNRSTLICEHCNYIAAPSGKTTKPTHFEEDVGANDRAERAVTLTSLIGYRLKLGKPIPLTWIMEYNTLACSER